VQPLPSRQRWCKQEEQGAGRVMGITAWASWPSVVPPSDCARFRDDGRPAPLTCEGRAPAVQEPSAAAFAPVGERCLRSTCVGPVAAPTRTIRLATQGCCWRQGEWALIPRSLRTMSGTGCRSAWPGHQGSDQRRDRTFRGISPNLPRPASRRRLRPPAAPSGPPGHRPLSDLPVR